MSPAVPVHGSNSRLYVGGYDLTPAMQDASVIEEISTADATTWGLAFESHITSPLQAGSMHGDGILDSTAASAGIAGGAHVGLKGLVGLDTTPAVLMFSDAAVGDYGAGMYGTVKKYDVKPVVKEVVDMQFDYLSNVGVDWLRTLHPMAVKTGTFNGTSLDNAALTSLGGVGYLMVPDFTGTTATFKIQHSVDNSAWVDLVTFANVTAVGNAQRIVVAPGTVNRYLRVICSAGTFSSARLSASFARA